MLNWDLLSSVITSATWLKPSMTFIGFRRKNRGPRLYDTQYLDPLHTCILVLFSVSSLLSSLNRQESFQYTIHWVLISAKPLLQELLLLPGILFPPHSIASSRWGPEQWCRRRVTLLPSLTRSSPLTIMALHISPSPHFVTVMQIGACTPICLFLSCYLSLPQFFPFQIVWQF